MLYQPLVPSVSPRFSWLTMLPWLLGMAAETSEVTIANVPDQWLQTYISHNACGLGNSITIPWPTLETADKREACVCWSAATCWIGAVSITLVSGSSASNTKKTMLMLGESKSLNCPHQKTYLPYNYLYWVECHMRQVQRRSMSLHLKYHVHLQLFCSKALQY